MLIGSDGVLYVHPTLTNPGDEDINGYWWTNVGVHVDSDGSDAVREQQRGGTHAHAHPDTPTRPHPDTPRYTRTREMDEYMPLPAPFIW